MRGRGARVNFSPMRPASTSAHRFFVFALLGLFGCGSSASAEDDDDGWIAGDDDDDDDSEGVTDGGATPSDGGTSGGDGAQDPAWGDGSEHCFEPECTSDLRSRLSSGGNCDEIEVELLVYNCGDAPITSEIPVSVYYSSSWSPSQPYENLEELVTELGVVPAGLPPDRYFALERLLPGELWNGRESGQLIFAFPPEPSDCNPLNDTMNLDVIFDCER